MLSPSAWSDWEIESVNVLSMGLGTGNPSETTRDRQSIGGYFAVICTIRVAFHTGTGTVPVSSGDLT